MKILSIETSCDETALSLLNIIDDKITQPKFEVIDTELYSQADLHKEYGGVFPSLAKREHSKNLMPLLLSLFKIDIHKPVAEAGATLSGSDSELSKKTQNLTEEQVIKIKEIFEREPELSDMIIEHISRIPKPEVDLIAVTYGPGLEPALWVGINFARALSYIWQIPVIPTNHMEGHMVSILKNNEVKVEFPMLSLLISGGHTELVLIKKWGDYETIGQTLDDAVGEAFDKVARLMDLPYPGGPEISKLAEEARKLKLQSDLVKLPRPMINSKDYNFSFSGLKTAVLYLIKKLKDEGLFDEEMKKIIALDFENSATEILIRKTTEAATEYDVKRIIIGGGVIANKHIRETFLKLGDFPVSVPDLDLTTDNAIMIGIAGYLKSLRLDNATICPEIKAVGNLSFIK